MAASIAEIQETLDRIARYQADAARRAAESNAAAEKQMAELRALFDESARLDAERKVEAALRDAEYKAQMAEYAQRDEERKAAWERERVVMETSRRKTDEAIRRSVNQFEKNWGNLIESFVGNQIIKLFADRGIPVTDGSAQNITGTIAGKMTEIDMILVNSDIAVVIEVKTTLERGDVKRFIYKLNHIREGFPRWVQPFATIFAGVAYIRAKPNAVQYAQDHGLFTIVATGESAKIVNAIDFVPHKWGT
ncbi:MAG: hypothetical protein ACRC46_11860 [Thermoguttaceae bacterium]